MPCLACNLLADLDRESVQRCFYCVIRLVEHARPAHGASRLAARRPRGGGKDLLVLQPVVRPFGTRWCQSITQSITRSSGRVRTVASKSYHFESIEPEALFPRKIMMEYTHDKIFIHMGHMTRDRLPVPLRRYDDTAIGSQRSANAATSPRAPGTVQIEPSAPSVTSTGQSRAVGRGARPAAMCRACECVGPCAVQGVSVARGSDARRVHGRVTAAGPATAPAIAPVTAPVIAPVISPVIANLPRGSVSVLRQPWSIDEQGGVREMGRGFETRPPTSRAAERR